jgi:hypothetical protein
MSRTKMVRAELVDALGTNHWNGTHADFVQEIAGKIYGQNERGRGVKKNRLTVAIPMELCYLLNQKNVDDGGGQQRQAALLFIESLAG